MRKNSSSKSVMSKVRELVAEMPDTSTIEDVQYRLYVKETIRSRMKSFDRGEFLSHADVESRVNKWRAK